MEELLYFLTGHFGQIIGPALTAGVYILIVCLAIGIAAWIFKKKTDCS